MCFLNVTCEIMNGEDVCSAEMISVQHGGMKLRVCENGVAHKLTWPHSTLLCVIIRMQNACATVKNAICCFTIAQIDMLTLNYQSKLPFQSC